jgi:pimeloyl-ACP methyl ester carboxylesterase
MKEPKSHTSVRVVFIAAAVLLAIAAPASAQPERRPLLLIGGTFVHAENPGWALVKAWFVNRAQYQPDAWNQRGLFLGELCLDTSNRAYDFSKPAGSALTRGALRCNLQNSEPPFGPVSPERPAAWNDPAGFTWQEFIDGLEDGNVSTAGLAAMSKSVEYVIEQIKIVKSLTGGRPIDIVAHSQGGVVARAAVRKLAEAGDTSAVARLVALGAPQYGVSPDARIFEEGLEQTVGAGLADLIAQIFLASCRDTGLLPFCPDMFLSDDGAFGSNPAKAQRETPIFSPSPGYTPVVGATETFAYRGATVIPNLNSLNGVGPTPGPTLYYHVYTRDYDGDADGNGDPVEFDERAIVEQMRLRRVTGTTNVFNWNIQDAAWHCFTESSHPLHHVNEWIDPVVQELIMAALGFPSFASQACRNTINGLNP